MLSKLSKVKIATIVGLLALSLGIAFMLPILKEKRKWQDYFDRTSISPANELLVNTIKGYDYLDPRNIVAFDLGAGYGNETKYLLEQGFRVYAIDFHEKSIESLHNRADLKNYRTLNVIQSDFQSLDWSQYPDADIIVAINSISFVNTHEFNTVWKEMTNNLKPGGIFVGRLFGDKLKWPNMYNMHLINIDSIKLMTQQYDVIYLNEIKKQEGESFQHAFEIVLKKK